MNASGRQVQCRKAGSTGMPSADLGTVSFLPEEKTIPAMESIYLKNVSYPLGSKMFPRFLDHILT
jgi:hypothetical protein